MFKNCFILFVSVWVAVTGPSLKAVANSGGEAAQEDSSIVVIKQLLITGNKITRMAIVNRELVFQENDTIPREFFARSLERTRENLMNTNLFNFVTVHHQMTSATDAVVIIDLTERWYIFPVPIFELVDRNFNEFAKTGDWSRINYGAFLNWDNFRGMNESVRMQFKWGYSQRIGLSYTIPYINRNQEEGLSFGVSYARNRESGYLVDDSKLKLFKDENSFVRKEILAGVRYTRRSGSAIDLSARSVATKSEVFSRKVCSV